MLKQNVKHNNLKAETRRIEFFEQSSIRSMVYDCSRCRSSVTADVHTESDNDVNKRKKRDKKSLFMNICLQARAQSAQLP